MTTERSAESGNMEVEDNGEEILMTKYTDQITLNSSDLKMSFKSPTTYKSADKAEFANSERYKLL